MQRIPVDLAGCLVLCTELPAAKVRDGRQQSDARSGEPLFTVGVCVIQAGSSDVITVTLPNEPSGLTPGRPVAVKGLTAIPWQQSDGGRTRHGIAFRAESVTAAGASGGKASG